MPAPIVTNEPSVLPVRELADDEYFVMMSFERHADHCYICSDPRRVQEDGETLCRRGTEYALDVAAYLYSKNRKSYSVVDRDLNQPTLVNIPRRCIATRDLLLALEDGLSLRKDKEKEKEKEREKAPAVQKPVISYDRTYHVSPRRSNSQRMTATEIIEREPRTVSVKTRRVIVYPSSQRGSPARGSPSRGSLYESDAADRVERVKESSRIYLRPTDYYR
ncbi:predicted protein [Aspergillus nidulans FGSC A4]|uniref:Uncharacterized protein n=1 Tax=Emericella nidulans (strain FGSC A4 / ATCC 38163 / CBS 112.46 / NRRL 194 / M139) TaxID=227321 RepID=Q5AW00_EMENI|nr:hypothetical protein [Aspergillus nidulans FGSC A4]EAA62110.1 predicted protein [Aspergillus nidulans FGSC A4]CBF79575.1 TPA: conserved hypothetical protein [Aspergillus nidulans FGSC A4]|eukprot:XP_680799.1 predicted protein [Aspergillus nidulans FGSC A4]